MSLESTTETDPIRSNGSRPPIASKLSDWSTSTLAENSRISSSSPPHPSSSRNSSSTYIPFSHNTLRENSNFKQSPKFNRYNSDANKEEYPRISRPIELLQTSYDVIVIGSGYGGAVAASRMARSGQSVCLLERGKERWPGEYPSSLLPIMKDFHTSGSSTFDRWGDQTGLYHLIVGEGQSAFVGNGLGGTSLLNSNIFLRADEGTMGLPDWPKELRQKGVLDPYYALAEHMLEPEPYPENFPTLSKLSILEKQAKALGLGDKFRRAPQTTRFSQGLNSTGVEMNASTLSGQDTTGLNDGSKSSTLVNYLADAWNFGAEMFCECEVRYIKKRREGDGYLVYFAWHGSNRGAFKSNIYEDLMWVHARNCVFLGAGSIGSTEILLRSQKLGLPMSFKLGTNMSGNGDILALGYNCNEVISSVGSERPNRNHPVGPTITGVIDCREGHENPLDGFVIEEGAIPQALSSIFQALVEMMPNKRSPSQMSSYQRAKRLLARVGSHLLGPYFKYGSMQKSQVLLVMSHDSNQAILTLKNNKPILKFLGVGRAEHAKRLRSLLARAAAVVGGTYVDNPIYATMAHQEITVHPMGGASMSPDGRGSSGVTNHFGEVFTGNGTATHRGLVVTDAAVIPAALGVNPFATITALAERSVKLTAERLGLDIDYATQNGILDLFGLPKYSVVHDKSTIETELLIEKARESKSSGIEFSEIMTGHIHVGDYLEGRKASVYHRGTQSARGLCYGARFFLSVKALNTETLINDPDHSAILTGSFTCALPGSPFMVQRGKFQLFSIDSQTTGTKNLIYDFDMIGINGERYHFHGFKTVDASVTLNPLAFWRATSTLYVSITQDNDMVVGRGMLHVRPQDFISQTTTITSTGPTLLSKSGSVVRFLNYFVKQSAGHFLTPLANLEYPIRYHRGFFNPTPATEVIVITASDGINSVLRMWQACPSNPDLEVHDLFMIPGASVDHQIFALPTIDQNAVNYFTKAGYRVWVLVHRIGMLTAEEGKNWTGYDTRLDIRAALEYIREVRGPQKIYTIAHCVGAIAFSSGLLDGSIPTDWIKGITASQAFMNLKLRPLNSAKVSMNAVSLYKMLAGNWISFSSPSNDSFIQRLLNQLLRLYPDSPSELCTNVACHRTSLAFGRLWSHRNLNEATHRAIHRFFGGCNMVLLHSLGTMGVRGHVAKNFPEAEDLVTPERVQKLKGIPIFLFSGSENMAWSPESTDLSYTLLRNTFGSRNYEREEIDGYGHLDCWMGTKAYVDVYPRVRRQVDKVCRGREYLDEKTSYVWENELKKSI